MKPWSSLHSCFVLFFSKQLGAQQFIATSWLQHLIHTRCARITLLISLKQATHGWKGIQMTVGTGGSPKNLNVCWCKCNKTPLFKVFSAHTQITFMLMLREHMPCLFATRGRFFMTFLDTFSSQHIETAKPRVFTRHALNCACLKKCLILLHPSAKMTFHCYLQWIWGPNSMTVNLFFLEHVSQNWSSPHPTPTPPHPQLLA